MDEYTSEVTRTQTRMAVGSLRKNPSNYQVFSFYISMGFLFGVSVLLGSLVAIQTEDQKMSSSTLLILVFLNIVTVIILFLSYTFYLRNIGKYVHGRIKPLNSNDGCTQQPSGYSPSRQSTPTVNASNSSSAQNTSSGLGESLFGLKK
jgi:hypothetical protein